jgi:hypothetical protein
MNCRSLPSFNYRGWLDKFQSLFGIADMRKFLRLPGIQFLSLVLTLYLLTEVSLISLEIIIVIKCIIKIISNIFNKILFCLVCIYSKKNGQLEPSKFRLTNRPRREDIPTTLPPVWNLESWTDALWRPVVLRPQDNQQCCSLHVAVLQRLQCVTC